MIQYPTDPEYLREWSDADLLAAYQRTDGAPGNAQAEVVLAEIERRDLDV